jgi:CBS domain-containing protein
MRRHHVGDLVVLAPNEGVRRPVGVVTDRDLVVEVLAAGVDPAGVTIGELVTRECETVGESADFWDALAHMRACAVRRIPVVDDRGGLVGILTYDDAIELIAEALGDLVRIVPRQIARERQERPARVAR